MKPGRRKGNGRYNYKIIQYKPPEQLIRDGLNLIWDENKTAQLRHHQRELRGVIYQAEQILSLLRRVEIINYLD